MNASVPSNPPQGGSGLRPPPPVDTAPGLCRFSPCGRKVAAKGLCGPHRRLEKAGEQLREIPHRRRMASVVALPGRPSVLALTPDERDCFEALCALRGWTVEQALAFEVRKQLRAALEAFVTAGES